MRLLPLAALLGLASALQAQPTNNSASSNTSTSQAANVAANRPPVVPPGNSQVNKLEQPQPYQRDPYAKERDQRERLDLIAQEDTAYWTEATFWAMIAQTLLAGGALTALILDLRQNRKSAERQLRAYVGWVKFDLDVHKTAEGGLVDGQFVTVWINDGQTPATRLSDRIGWIAITGPLPDDFDFPEGGAEGPCDNLVLGPGRDFKSVSAQKLPAKEYWAAAEGKLRIFVWASVSYTDAFKQRRRSEVAAEFLVAPLQSGGQSISFNAIPPHNAVDGQCMRPPEK